jgi:hypothetical protein
MADELPALIIEYHGKPGSDKECRLKRLSIWPTKTAEKVWEEPTVLKALSEVAMQCSRTQPKLRRTVVDVLPDLEQLLLRSSSAGVFG